MIAFALIQLSARRAMYAVAALLVLAALLVSLRVHAQTVANASEATAAQTADLALYRAFGEQSGLASVTHDFVVNLYTDPRTRDYFVGVSKKRLESKLNEQFCTLTGGPCVYTGRSMHEAHEGLNVDRAAFNAVVEELEDAMEKNHVPYHAQNQLLARLAPMHREIEERN